MLGKSNDPTIVCPNTPGGEAKRVLAPRPTFLPNLFPFWPTKLVGGIDRDTWPRKAAVASSAELPQQMVLVQQVLGSDISSTTSLGSLSSLHVLSRLETSIFTREGK